MTVAVWGGGATDDLAERIRTGDVAIDLYRPVSLLGWYLASDLGRAAYHLLTRGVAPTIVGALLFDLRFPSSAGGRGSASPSRGRSRSLVSFGDPDARGRPARSGCSTTTGPSTSLAFLRRPSSAG